MARLCLLTAFSFALGVTHNIPLLRDVLTAPRFIAGKLSTKYLGEEYPDGFKGYKLSEQELDHLVVTSAVAHAVRSSNAADIEPRTHAQGEASGSTNPEMADA